MGDSAMDGSMGAMDTALMKAYQGNRKQMKPAKQPAKRPMSPLADYRKR
jgi:hypothetical protein